MRTSAGARVVSKTECCRHTALSTVGRKQDGGDVGGGEKSDISGSRAWTGRRRPIDLDDTNRVNGNLQRMIAV